MDFKQLEAFAHVVRLGSFSKAAESLYLTQPTISAHISTLERELETLLIDRRSKKAFPTESGKALYAYALEMLALREQAAAACRQQGDNLTGVIGIAASTVTYQYVLPRLMSQFREKHSGVTFDIKRYDSKGVAREIIEGRAEVGLTGSIMEGNCVYRELMEDDLVVVTPSGAPFDAMADQDFTLEELGRHPFILREPGSGTRREIERYLHGLGISLDKLSIAAHMEEPDAIKNAVSQGLGISIISRLAISDFQQLGLVRAFPLMGQPIKRKLYIVRHKRRALTPVAGAFLDFALDNRNG